MGDIFRESTFHSLIAVNALSLVRPIQKFHSLAARFVGLPKELVPSRAVRVKKIFRDFLFFSGAIEIGFEVE